MVLREALVIAGAGIACGWGITLAGGRWMESLLYDTSRADPLILGSAALVMLAVAAAATLLPAAADSRANPASLLRA
jgi:putative ABC transport system permease protein